MAEYMSYEEYLVKVKEGIVTEKGNCPVTPLLRKLQGKWKTQILYELWACSQFSEFFKSKKLKIRNYQILKIQFTADFSLLFG